MNKTLILVGLFLGLSAVAQSNTNTLYCYKVKDHQGTLSKMSYAFIKQEIGSVKVEVYNNNLYDKTLDFSSNKTSLADLEINGRLIITGPSAAYNTINANPTSRNNSLKIKSLTVRPISQSSRQIVAEGTLRLGSLENLVKCFNQRQ